MGYSILGVVTLREAGELCEFPIQNIIFYELINEKCLSSDKSVNKLINPSPHQQSMKICPESIAEVRQPIL